MSNVQKPKNYIDNNIIFGELVSKLQILYSQDFKIFVFTSTTYGDSYMRVYEQKSCNFRAFEKWLHNADFVGFVHKSECPPEMIEALKEHRGTLSLSHDEQNFAARFSRSNGIEMVEHWVIHPDVYHAVKNVWLQIFLLFALVVLFIVWFVKCV